MFFKAHPHMHNVDAPPPPRPPQQQYQSCINSLFNSPLIWPDFKTRPDAWWRPINLISYMWKRIHPQGGDVGLTLDTPPCWNHYFIKWSLTKPSHQITCCQRLKSRAGRHESAAFVRFPSFKRNIPAYKLFPQHPRRAVLSIVKRVKVCGEPNTFPVPKISPPCLKLWNWILKTRAWPCHTL